MYSFCNVHNCSWGTKGLDNSSHGLGNAILNNRKTVFNRFRLTTVLIWVLTNAFMTYFYIASDNFRVSVTYYILLLYLVYVGFKGISGITIALRVSP
jgi:hypothetical protein